MCIPSKQFYVTKLSTLENYYWVCLSIQDDDRTLKSKHSNEVFVEREITLVWLLLLDCPICYPTLG